MDATLLRAGRVAVMIQALLSTSPAEALSLDAWMEHLAPLGVEQLQINLSEEEIGVQIQAIGWLFFPLPSWGKSVPITVLSWVEGDGVATPRHHEAYGRRRFV